MANRKLLINTISEPKKQQLVLSDEKKVDVNEKLKSPICSFLGHVDAGKTSLMDTIRGTNIQSEEAGGITQSIGSSFVSIENIVDITKEINGKFQVTPEIPGIIIIDTPGHAAFNVLRERGSSLCDIAILVVEINDGVKPQTIESVKLLREKKIPFVIAATKLDTINDYIITNETSLRKVFKKQSKNTIQIIETCLEDIKYELSKEDVNCEFYFKNKKPNSIYSIIPISSKTKEGLSDLLSLLVYISQNWMNNKITYIDKVDATIMECVQDTKLGWILDVIVKNGTIKIGDKFAVSGKDGERIVTVRKLLIKCSNNSLQEVPCVRASCGVRIMGSNCNKCYAGTKIHPIETNEYDALEKAKYEMEHFWDKFKLNKTGVCLQAATFGEIDAMYQVFKKDNIPIMNLNLNKLQERDIERLQGKIENIEDTEFKTLLYFGKITPKEEQLYYKLSKDKGIHFIHSEIIYDLLDKYNKYHQECLKHRQKDLIDKGSAVYPCKLRIFSHHIYLNGGAGHLLFGVKVKEGRLRIGSPLYIKQNKYKVDANKKKIITNVSEKGFELGKVISIQKNNTDIELADQGDEVCIRLDNPNYLSYGRHFDNKDTIISKLTRESIDILKKDYREEMAKEDWMLVIELMKDLDIERKT
jgi:translation initiation factor 5B